MKIHITWCTEDVLHTAEEQEVSLTEKEADEILQMIEKNHDSEFGICWDTLRFHILEYKDFRDNAKIQSDEKLLYNLFA